MEGKSTWDEMTLRERRELMEALPDRVRKDSRRLYRAAIVWRLADTLPLAERRRRWSAICR